MNTKNIFHLALSITLAAATYFTPAHAEIKTEAEEGKASLMAAYLARTKGDHKTAARIYIELAEKGDASAAYYAYSYLLAGKHVEKNEVHAQRYLEQAAKDGHADAIFDLGLQDFNAQRNSSALSKFRRASQNGSTRANVALGAAYERGEFGLTTDSARAIEHYQRAYDGGHYPILPTLYELYLSRNEELRALGLTEDYLANVEGTWLKMYGLKQSMGQKLTDASGYRNGLSTDEGKYAAYAASKVGQYYLNQGETHASMARFYRAYFYMVQYAHGFSDDERKNKARPVTVSREIINVRENPSAQSSIVAKMKKGTVLFDVSITDDVERWIRIYEPVDKVYGWVATYLVEG